MYRQQMEVAKEYLKCARADLRTSIVLRHMRINSLSIYHLSQAIEHVERAYYSIGDVDLKDIRIGGHDTLKMIEQLKKRDMVLPKGKNTQSETVREAYQLTFRLINNNLSSLFNLRNVKVRPDGVIELPDKIELAKAKKEDLDTAISIADKIYPITVESIFMEEGIDIAEDFIGFKKNKNLLKSDYNNPHFYLKLKLPASEKVSSVVFMLIKTQDVKIFGDLITLSYIASAHLNFSRYPYEERSLWPTEYDKGNVEVIKVYNELYKRTDKIIKECYGIVNFHLKN